MRCKVSITGLIRLSCARAGCLEPEGWLHVCGMFMGHFTNQNLNMVVAKCWVLAFAVRDRTFMCLLFTATVTYIYMTCFLLCTNINCCRSGWRCACLFPVCGLFEWPCIIRSGLVHHLCAWTSTVFIGTYYRWGLINNVWVTFASQTANVNFFLPISELE